MSHNFPFDRVIHWFLQEKRGQVPKKICFESQQRGAIDLSARIAASPLLIKSPFITLDNSSVKGSGTQPWDARCSERRPGQVRYTAAVLQASRGRWDLEDAATHLPPERSDQTTSQATLSCVIAPCVGSVPGNCQFLGHDRVAEVQDIAPGDLRRDNKHFVYVCCAESRYDTAAWKEDVVTYHRRPDAVTRGWHG